MKTTTKKSKGKSPGLAHVSHVWENVSTKSWQRFDGALSSALRNAVRSGMTFGLNDFRYMADKLRMSRWIGEIDRIYSIACGSDRGKENPSAVAAIEHYLKREPFIWAEEVKTPGRLHVGSDFTWNGERVTVTSFDDKAKSLTACSYKANDGNEDAGSLIYVGGEYRKVEARKDSADGSIVMRLSGPCDDGNESRKILHRYSISAAELKTGRADYDRRRRAHEKTFSAATTLDELEAARLAASAEGAQAYRHFDIEILTQAMSDAKKRIEESMSVADRQEHESRLQSRAADRLERWVNGEDVRDYVGAEVRLRIKDDHVEVSNGNRVSIDAAKKTLRFVSKHRAAGWETNGQVHDVDAFRLRSVSDDGVQIGCTLIPWAEVDRIESLLTK